MARENGLHSSNRTVLLVSPHFPPVNAPDHQRVRMALPYLREFGWNPYVLSVDPDQVEGAKDSLLEQVLPTDFSLSRTGALPFKHSRLVGFGDLGVRAFSYLRNAGNQILKTQKIDLVYFSTTVFNVFALSRGWQRRFGTPYALDFQDPWLTDYYEQANAPSPPGGWAKYRAAQLLAKRLEPFSLARVAHVTSVSAAYPETLKSRYPWLTEDHFTVLPFGASELDFQSLETLKVRQTVFDKHDGKQHWVYVGRGGDDMAFALRSLFQAVRARKDTQPGGVNNLRLHFVGTDYAPAGRSRKTVEPIAREFGLADIVSERCERISYFEALKCLVDADALVVVGSDDPGYTASKIYPYILAQKPLLAIFNEKSSVVDVLCATGSGTVVTFNENSQVADVAEKITKSWLNTPALPNNNTNWFAFEQYTAREMTRRLCRVFDSCVATPQSNAS